MTIPEIYPGIERAAVVVGADVYQLYGVTDAIAHEYEFGGGNHMATSRTPLDWFRYQVGMRSFRAFAQGKATWILNYSWDKDTRIAPPEPMMNLAMSVVMAGANFWDAATHVMSGSNDLPTRKRIFEWIEKHEKTLYAPRTPIHPIGVYFSPATRNYFPDEFIRSYQGMVILLLQSHREMQIVTPRTLAAFRGSTLILPDVRLLGDEERHALSAQVSRGTRLIVTGTDATGLSSGAVRRFPECPGRAYLERLEKDFETTNPSAAVDGHRGARAGSGRPRRRVLVGRDRHRAGAREAAHLLRQLRRSGGRAECRAKAAAGHPRQRPRRRQRQGLVPAVPGRGRGDFEASVRTARSCSCCRRFRRARSSGSRSSWG